jgi:hypothetical protein
MPEELMAQQLSIAKRSLQQEACQRRVMIRFVLEHLNQLQKVVCQLGIVNALQTTDGVFAYFRNGISNVQQLRMIKPLRSSSQQHWVQVGGVLTSSASTGGIGAHLASSLQV